jgi:DNA-binding XRE family transcriptional regulator
MHKKSGVWPSYTLPQMSRAGNYHNSIGCFLDLTSMSVQQEPTVPVVTPSQAIHIGTNALLALLEQEVASAASAFARQNASDTESSAARFKEYREATQASQDSMRSQIDAQKQTISLLRADIERVKNQETDAFNAMRHDLTRSKIIFETLGVVPSSEADSNAFTFAREALNVFASLELPSGTATEQPVDESYWANVTSNTLIPTLRRISGAVILFHFFNNSTSSRG